jgi:ubiquinone/menaquinone biosynthesis C-methylase UbiE
MKSQADHFDQIADDYDETIAEHVMAHLTRRRGELVCSLATGGRVLDVGCGTGRLLASLPPEFEPTGVDVSEAMLDKARQQGLTVIPASGHSLPFADDSFDVVTTFAVLHHLIEPDRVRATLREMARVVKPGGAVVAWDHNPINPYWRILMARVPQDQGDERLVPARTIVRALREAGMREVNLRRMTFTPDFTPRPMLRTVAKLERALERTPGVRKFAAHNVVIAR